MATPPEKLAQSLEVLRKLQNEYATKTIRSKDISRTHKERLLTNGFLQEVIKGWYIAANPDEIPGDSTAWYISFWKFCSEYLRYRFTDDWCLSPEQSVSIHSGNMTVPQQLLVRSPKANNNIVNLPHNTSIFDVKTSLPKKSNIENRDGLNIFSLPSALIACSPNFFSRHSTDARAALSMVKDASGILVQLLDGGHSTVAGRLAGAFRNVGREHIADDILETMKSAQYDVREDDPFKDRLLYFMENRETSPYVNRIKLMWQQMRQTVIDNFPKVTGFPKDINSYLTHVNDIYATDAYHSLSIEGYRVTPELIDRVKSGNWNPDVNEADSEHKNAMAARGYWLAFQSVKESIQKILDGMNPGAIAERDQRIWYREMFSPAVTAGLLKPSDLAGYRNSQVYIRGSMHVPLHHNALRDVMPALFDLLREETEASVRIVLGHFLFVYIHPYMDGNGRIGRFLMNAMLASGGFPWTTILMESRNEYMAALEKASVEQNVFDFTNFIAKHVRAGM